jgi:hypothetical protein
MSWRKAGAFDWVEDEKGITLTHESGDVLMLIGEEEATFAFDELKEFARILGQCYTAAVTAKAMMNVTGAHDRRALMGVTHER